MSGKVFEDVDDAAAARMFERAGRLAEAGRGNWSPPTAEELGNELPQYRVECLLGKGSMGVVYKAEQIRLQRLVALKLIRPDLAGDPDFTRWFEREARFLAKMHHPRIVSVYDLGQTKSGAQYFVMEYVEGVSLECLLEESAVSPVQAFELISQICEALQYAHGLGVVHRDLKPGNVLIGLDGMPKLVDFGLARSLLDTEGRCTFVNLAMGTRDYMAPEQCHGTADHRSDIYAVGAILYRMLSGECPHGFLDPFARRLGLDSSLDEILGKALHHDADRRYQSAEDFRKAIDVVRQRDIAPKAAVSRPFWSRRRLLALLVLVLAIPFGLLARYALHQAIQTPTSFRPNGQEAKDLDVHSLLADHPRTRRAESTRSERTELPFTKLDETFNPNPDGTVSEMLPLADGGILVGGQFKNIAGRTQPCLAKLRHDGTLDASFCSKLQPSNLSQVTGLVAQPDGRIVVCGAFSLLGGVASANIARLNPDGSVDRSFRAQISGVFCHTATVQRDGKIVVVGIFRYINGESYRNIGRINADGSLDPTFHPDANKPVRCVAIQQDGKILVGGHFWLLAQEECRWLGRLNVDGSLDKSFNSTLGGERSKIGLPGLAGTGISRIKVRPDGRILVAGDFATAGGKPHNSVVLLRPDGSPDESFGDPQIDTPASCIAERANGQILVGGFFHSVSGYARHSLALLNPDGSLEKSFLANAEGPVITLAVEQDENLLVGGAFGKLDGESHPSLGRIVPAR